MPGLEGAAAEFCLGSRGGSYLVFVDQVGEELESFHDGRVGEIGGSIVILPVIRPVLIHQGRKAAFLIHGHFSPPLHHVGDVKAGVVGAFTVFILGELLCHFQQLVPIPGVVRVCYAGLVEDVLVVGHHLDGQAHGEADQLALIGELLKRHGNVIILLQVGSEILAEVGQYVLRAKLQGVVRHFQYIGGGAG